MSEEGGVAGRECSPGRSRETRGTGWWRLRWAMARAVNPQRKTPAVRRYPVGGHAHSGALQIGSDGEWRRHAGLRMPCA